MRTASPTGTGTSAAILLALAAQGAPALAQFGPPRIVATGGGSLEEVQAVDLDSDGDQDVIVCREADTVPALTWHANLGGGTFGGAQTLNFSAFSASRVRAFDEGPDGDVDLVASVSYYTPGTGFGSYLEVYRNLGGAVFDRFTIDYLTNASAALELGDVDGDGFLDVFYAGWTDAAVYFRRGSPQGFGARQTATLQAYSPNDLVLADLDGDGDQDFALAGFSSTEIVWFENTNGAGTFGPRRVLDAQLTGASGIDAADVDGDGDLDVLYVVHPNTVRWVENLGGGTFGTVRTVTTVGYPGRVVLGFDVDGDADRDVLVSEFYGASWHPNDGTGQFGARQVITGATVAMRSLDTADLSGDGVPDVLLASSPTSGAWIAWFENRVIGPLGSNFCEPAVPNSTGLPGVMTAVGSPSVAVGHATLRAVQLPVDKPSLFIASQTTGYVPQFGGGVGTLCLGSPIRRFGGVASTSGTGERQVELDFATSLGTPILPGQAWHFQLWHRDAGGPNLTDGLHVVFTP